MAVGLIASTVLDQVFQHIRSHTITMEMWNTVKAVYNICSEMASIDLCQKLHSKKLSDNSDAIAHIGCLIDMQEQLTALGSTLADKEFTGVILSSLPKSYQDVIQSIAAAVNQMGTSITTDRVI